MSREPSLRYSTLNCAFSQPSTATFEGWPGQASSELQSLQGISTTSGYLDGESSLISPLVTETAPLGLSIHNFQQLSPLCVSSSTQEHSGVEAALSVTKKEIPCILCRFRLHMGLCQEGISPAPIGITTPFGSARSHHPPALVGPFVLKPP